MSPINLAGVGSMASAMIRLTDRIRTQRFAVLRKPGSLEDCRVERAVLI